MTGLSMSICLLLYVIFVRWKQQLFFFFRYRPTKNPTLQIVIRTVGIAR